MSQLYAIPVCGVSDGVPRLVNRQFDDRSESTTNVRELLQQLL